MPITSYATLKTEIIEYLDQDDLADHVDGFIDFAETLHKSAPDKDNPARGGLRFREMLRRSQATLATTSRYLALPESFLQMRAMRIAAAQEGKLDELSLAELERYRTDVAGCPRYFTVHEEIEFNRKPSTATAIEMIYYAELTPLSDASTTNALLTKAPHAYLYAALMAAEPFLANDERIATWSGLYGGLASGLNNVRVSLAGPLASRVAGWTP